MSREQLSENAVNKGWPSADSDAKLTHDRSLDVHGWQPIETVPFDDLVLIWDGFDVCIAKSIRGEWISFGCDGAAVRLMDDFGTSYQEPGKPSHWMPLPAPPVLP